MWLVVEVEEDRRVGLERGGDRTPEGGRVVGIGHHLLASRLRGPRRIPVQVEDRVEAALM